MDGNEVAARRQITTSRQRSPHGRRRGSTTVEFAFVAIPLFLFVFASVEFQRAAMARNSMEEAARAGCRVAILQGSTMSDVEAEVAEILGVAGISDYTVTTDPSDVASVERWEPVSVTVSAAYADISWVPVPNYLGAMTFVSSCTLPKEASSGG